MQKQFQSHVGCVVDIATPSKRKLRALGIFWSLIALLPLVLLNYVIFDALSSDDPILTGHRLAFLGLLLMPMIFWFALGSAVQRFRAASTEGRYFRSGPGGISVCLPDDSARGTWRFSLNNLKFDVAWDHVKTWYPFKDTINGIVTERAIIFETIHDEKIKIKTFHFAEKQEQIVTSITRSRSIVPEDAFEARIEQVHIEQSFSLPRQGREPSIGFKKKRDRVKEIDLRIVGRLQRPAYVERVADVVEAKIMSVCPRANGFRCSRKRYRPFKEWKDVFGIRLFVRRGLLHGYEIQLEPNDSESRRLTISICRSNLITDIRRYISMGIAGVSVVLCFRWFWTVEYWLGDFSDLAPLVGLAFFLAVVGISTGLMELPIRLFRLLLTNKQHDEAQKQGIKVRIQELTTELSV